MAKKDPKIMDEDSLDTELGSIVARRQQLLDNRAQAEALISMINSDLSDIETEIEEYRKERKSRS